MHTRLTQLLDLQLPLIQAPMAGVSTPQLAAAVSNAGGLGSLAVGAMDAASAHDAVTETMTLTARPICVNVFTNSITDLSPLSELTGLMYLQLHTNSITDISALAELTSLTSLDFQRNSITDISPLSGLTSLTSLVLWGNSITDINPLSGLTSLRDLYLRENP